MGVFAMFAPLEVLMTAMTELLYSLPVLLLWFGPAVLVVFMFAWSHTHAPASEPTHHPHAHPIA